MTKNPSILPILLVITITLLTALSIGGCTNRHRNKLGPEIAPATKADPEPAADPAKLVQVGRYSAVTAAPTEAQLHPLRVMIQITLPNDVGTVREAARYLLWRSGYRLEEPADQQPEVTALLAKPLPQVHRQLGPMELQDALHVLGGSGYHIDIDHIARVVSYDLNRKEPEAGPGMSDEMNNPASETDRGEQS